MMLSTVFRNRFADRGRC